MRRNEREGESSFLLHVWCLFSHCQHLSLVLQNKPPTHLLATLKPLRRIRESQAEDQNRAAEIAVWRKVSAFLHDIQVTEGLSLRALFNELDINHDNVVTPEEFVKRMR